MKISLKELHDNTLSYNIPIENLSIKDMNKHIKELKSKYDITLYVDEKYAFAALVVFKEVSIRPITTYLRYIAALHEIGHIAIDDGNTPDEKQKMIREKNAWEWAKKNSLVWNKNADKFMTKCIHSHEIDCAKTK